MAPSLSSMSWLWTAPIRRGGPHDVVLQLQITSVVYFLAPAHAGLKIRVGQFERWRGVRALSGLHAAVQRKLHRSRRTRLMSDAAPCPEANVW